MEIGVVTHYFDKVGVVAIKLSKGLKVGDKVKIKGGDVEFEQTIESMQIHNEKVEKAKAGDEIGIKVEQKANKNYKIYKVK